MFGKKRPATSRTTSEDDAHAKSAYSVRRHRGRAASSVGGGGSAPSTAQTPDRADAPLPDLHRGAGRRRERVRRAARLRCARRRPSAAAKRSSTSRSTACCGRSTRTRASSRREHSRRCASGRRGATSASASASCVRSPGDITVTSLFEGSPAYRAGIRRGDIIARVGDEDGQGLADRGRRQARQGARRARSVDLTIRRPGLDTLIPLTVERDEIKIASVRTAFMIAPGHRLRPAAGLLGDDQRRTGRGARRG